MENKTPDMEICTKKMLKSVTVFFSQIIVIYIVVITSIVNLSIQDCTKPGVCNLWMAVLWPLHEQDKYRIEKLLDEKTIGKRCYVLVKWVTYPEKCAEWILKTSILNVK